jgi:thioredoxin 1
MKSSFFIVLFVCLFSSSYSQIVKLSVRKYKAEATSYKFNNILDVRSLDEFNEGHLAGADNIDWNGSDFDAFVDRYNKSVVVYVYCLSGGRSELAANRLKELGFKKIVLLDCGLMSWRAAGYDLVGKSIVKELLLGDFEKLYKGKSKKILFDFYADWCAPCILMNPILDALEKKLSGDIEVIRINADMNPRLSKEINIGGLPCFLFYHNDSLVWKRLGFIEQSELNTLISK